MLATVVIVPLLLLDRFAARAARGGEVALKLQIFLLQNIPMNYVYKKSDTRFTSDKQVHRYISSLRAIVKVHRTNHNHANGNDDGNSQYNSASNCKKHTSGTYIFHTFL